MTDAMWHFVGWGKRYLSPEEIQKMKKNMRKAPWIHAKGERYHLQEEQEADKIINEQLLSNKNK